MGVCAPDMNSCTPKCKVCTGVNAGKAYDCANPCSCYNSSGLQSYTWNGFDCIKQNECAPYSGTSCTGTLTVYFGWRAIADNTGPAATNGPDISDTTDKAYELIGTQAAAGYWTELNKSVVLTANDPRFPVGYGWVFNLPTRNPVYNYNGKSYLLNRFGGTSQIGIQPYISFANGGTSYIDPFGFWGMGQGPFCILNCCGCTPCSLNFGCASGAGQIASPASTGELYGKVSVELVDMVVVARWTSGPNAATSYWTRIGG